MYLITVTTNKGLRAQFKSQETRSEIQVLTSRVSREWIQDIKDWYIERSVYSLYDFKIRIDEVCGSTIQNVEWWSMEGLRRLYDENNKDETDMKAKDKESLLSIFKMNPCVENYIPLYNLGIKMFERYNNDWHEVVTYKSDFSDIDPHHFIYNSPNMEDIGGIYVSRK